MLKVLFVVPIPPPYGGIANWTRLIQKYIDKTHRIDDEYINTAPKNRSVDGRNLYERIVVQGFEMLKMRRELIQKSYSFKPSVIHITTSGQFAIIRDILLLRTAKKLNIPTVYHLRFGRVPEIAETNTREWKMLVKAVRLATTVISIDIRTTNTIQHYIPNIDVRYIPNPFDYGEYKPVNNEVKKNEVVFVGWVVKSKGVEELLTAWHNIYNLHPEWHLKIVGPYKKDYFKFLKSTFPINGVEFTGEMPHAETQQILSQAKIFVLPSYTEGFPNAVLEAMAYEKAIVASNVGAIPDMLSGSCGKVIQPKNFISIEQAVNDLIEDEARAMNMGKSAKEKLQREYSIDAVFSQYICAWKSEMYS